MALFSGFAPEVASSQSGDLPSSGTRGRISQTAYPPCDQLNMHSTSPTLLLRLRNPADQIAWRQFVELYTPLLFYWARRRGMQSSDAADLVQDVLSTLIQKLPDFEYQLGRSFRNWLRTVTVNKWRDRQRKRLELGVGGDEGPQLEAESPTDDCFEEREYRQYLYQRALEVVRRDYNESTWEACWQAITTDKSAAEIGAALGLTEGAVYAAKCRILKRLREDLAGLES